MPRCVRLRDCGGGTAVPQGQRLVSSLFVNRRTPVYGTDDMDLANVRLTLLMDNSYLNTLSLSFSHST